MRSSRLVLVVAGLTLLSGCADPVQRMTDAPGEQSAEDRPAADETTNPSPGVSGRPAGGAPAPKTEPGAVSHLLASGCPNECFEPSIATDVAGRTVIAPSYGQPSVGSADGGRTFYDLPGVPLPDGSPATAESEDGWLVAAPDEPRVYWITFLAQAPPAIHVASSPDGGRTWDRNVGLNPVQGQRNVVLVDRPWLAVAPEGVVYVTYNNEGGLWLARSIDGGRSFGPFGPVTQALGNLGGAGAGPPVVDGQGRVIVPYFGNPTGPFTPPGVPAEKAMVAVSNDAGLTFEHRPVGPPGVFFPALAEGTDGRLYMAWTSDEGEVLVSSSADHGTTWSVAEPWHDGQAAVVGPALLANGPAVVVTWFHRTAPNQYELWSATGPGQAQRLAAGLATMDHPSRGDIPGTDYSSAARLADGGIGIVWGATADATLGITIVH